MTIALIAALSLFCLILIAYARVLDKACTRAEEYERVAQGQVLYLRRENDRLTRYGTFWRNMSAKHYNELLDRSAQQEDTPVRCRPDLIDISDLLERIQ